MVRSFRLTGAADIGPERGRGQRIAWSNPKDDDRPFTAYPCGMPNARLRWPSLDRQVALAERLHGDDGKRRVTEWVAAQTDRIGNPEFARLFSDHIDLPGIVSLDYAHRYVRSRRGSLIGGIRFFGQDAERPFVEIIAHDFEDVAALADTAAVEWRAFSPPHIRLRIMPDEVLDERAHMDTSVYAARYGDMAGRDGRVQLEPFDHPDVALAIVGERYDALAHDDLALRRNVSPIDPHHARALWAAEQLHAIAVAGRGIVGLIAAAPGQIDWIEGDEVMEEVVAVEHAGRGYAAAAQAALAALSANNPDTRLVGTIDGLNAASRRTAERAGRKRVMDYVLFSLAQQAAEVAMSAEQGLEVGSTT